MPGKVLTEGDRAMRSDQVRFHHNVDGTGVTIGIISDSFDALGKADADIRRGELPGQENPNGYINPVTVLRDDPTGTDEGRAMAQIIHDVAPGADLLFYSPRSVLDFARGIDELVAAGADIIVDDLGFSEQPFFQDGPVSQAVSRAVRQGVTYISAAGNYGRASYESEFRPSSQTFTISGATFEAHDFDPGIATDIFQSITIPGFSDFDIVFNWSEPFRSFGLGEGAANDIDLFLMTQPRVPVSFQDVALVAASLDANIGGDPKEFLSVSNRSFRETEYYLVIGKQQGISNAPSPELMKWIDFEDAGTEYEYVNEFSGQTANGTVYGHPNAEGAIAVGAVQFNRTPPFGETIITPRRYTSLGGTPILFDTRGRALSNPIIRDKPQLIGPDGVSTSVLDFETFPGTSAAAPHIAAVVALMLERAGKRRLSPDDIREMLLNSTLDVGDSGVDRVTGSGFIQANLAVMSVAPTRVLADGQSRLRGTARADNLVGTQKNDRLIGRGGFDVLMGLRGRDRLRGNGGNDWLKGAAGRDVLIGNRGNDMLSGGNGRDRLLGKGGNDHLVGGRGNDQLTGAGGSDLLWGKGGRDRLFGQRGGDRFVLEKAPGVDIITDYQDGSDKFVLADELTFEQLTFRSRGARTVIKLGRSTLARIDNLRPEQLTVDDVIDVALPTESV